MLNIDLSKKRVVVTGASSGIGLSVAKMMSLAGAMVCGCGTVSEGSKKVEKYYQLTNQAKYIQCDMTKTSSIEKFIKDAVEYLGGIDILVSNAGKNVFYNTEDCDIEQFNYNTDLNLKSHWYISKLAKPYLDISENGVIIIMTSNHGFQTMRNCFPYNVTKTALIGLVRSIAIDFSPKVRAIGIAPGFIETPSSDIYFGNITEGDAEKAKTRLRHLTRSLGESDDVGAFCVFLSSSYAKFMTGTTIVIDGGRTALLED